jgi:hypothetical protein
LRVLYLLALQAHAVELLHQVHLAALLGEREVLVVNVGDQLLRVKLLAYDFVLLLHFVGDVSALMNGRQEGVVPERRPHGSRHVRAKNDEARQVFVFRPQAAR